MLICIKSDSHQNCHPRKILKLPTLYQYDWIRFQRGIEIVFVSEFCHFFSELLALENGTLDSAGFIGYWD